MFRSQIDTPKDVSTGDSRSSWLVPALAFSSLVSIPVFLVVGYYYGTRYQPQAEFSHYQAQLQQQSDLVAQTRDEIEANLEAYTQRLGFLQAHVNRLNALGSKLVAMAELDEGEFNFMNVPAMGGANEEQMSHAADASDELTRHIELLELSLLAKQQQLEILEELIFSKNLNEDIRPQARPVVAGWISSSFGYRTDPFSGKRQFHNGIDFAGKAGTPILAAAGGVVIAAGKSGHYGNLVEIDHKNGYISRYAHSSEVLVQVGDVVKKGEKIAKMGSTGRSTGTHLHFEVIKEGKRINPSRLLKPNNS